MASNRLPDQLDRLFSLCEDMLTGLLEHEGPLEIEQNTHAKLSQALSAARAAEMAYGDSQAARKTANGVVNTADATAKVFISHARKRLSMFFGERYSTEWAAAGWPNGSTATPNTQDERFSLVESIRLHLAGHAAHESADMAVTAAHAATLKGNLATARGVLDQKLTLQGKARQVRNEQVRKLRKRMSALIGELDGQMEGDDMRWYAFGLSRPVDEEAPEPPTFMTGVAGIELQTILLDWDDPLRADRFRVWIKIVGVDETFRAVQTVHDSDATLEDLPSGATVKAYVTSVNDAGESQPGPETEVVVP
jgi:hypothetical protein